MNEWTRRLCFGCGVLFCSVCSTSGQTIIGSPRPAYSDLSGQRYFKCSHLYIGSRQVSHGDPLRLYTLCTILLPLARRLPTLHFEPVPRIISSFQHVSLSPRFYLSFFLSLLTQHTLHRHHVLHHPVHHQRDPIPRPRQAAHLLGRRRGHLQCGPDAHHQGGLCRVVSCCCTRLIPGFRRRREGLRIHVKKTCSSLSSERRSSAAVLTPLSSGASRYYTRWSGLADKSQEMSRSATSFLQEVEPPWLVWLSSPLVSPTRESLPPCPSHLPSFPPRKLALTPHRTAVSQSAPPTDNVHPVSTPSPASPTRSSRARSTLVSVRASSQ